MEVIEIKESMFRLDEWEPEYGIGSEGSGSSKVDPPGVRYHVRITLKNRDDAEHIAKAYTNYWNLSKYIWGFEFSESGQPHLHGAVTMPLAYNTGTMSKFMAKLKHLLEGVPGYHHELEKDELKNVVYCCKDDDVVLSNYNCSELEIIKNKILGIKEDMKTSPRDKIYKKIKIWFEQKYRAVGLDGYVTYDDCSFTDIKREICHIYIDEWDKLPPVNLKQLAIYCAFKIGSGWDVDGYL